MLAGGVEECDPIEQQGVRVTAVVSLDCRPVFRSDIPDEANPGADRRRFEHDSSVGHRTAVHVDAHAAGQGQTAGNSPLISRPEGRPVSGRCCRLARPAESVERRSILEAGTLIPVGMPLRSVEFDHSVLRPRLELMGPAWPGRSREDCPQLLLTGFPVGEGAGVPSQSECEIQLRCRAIPGVRRVRGCRPAGHITAIRHFEQARAVDRQQAGVPQGVSLPNVRCDLLRSDLADVGQILSNLSVRQETLQPGQGAKCHGHPPDRTRRAFGTCTRSFEPRRSIYEPMEIKSGKVPEAIALQRPANLGVELPPCVEAARRRCRDVVIQPGWLDDPPVGHAEDVIGARPQICIRRYARELTRIDIRSRGRHTQAPGPQIGQFNPRSLRSGFRHIDAIDEQRVAVDRATEPRTSRDSGREIDEVCNRPMSRNVVQRIRVDLCHECGVGHIDLR